MGDKYNIKEGLQKFPSFHYNELNDLISKKEIFSKEATLNSLKGLKDTFLQLNKEISNLIEINCNNFNGQTESYNRKTYNYLIDSNLTILFCDAIIYKLEPKKKEQFQFNINEYTQELKSKYGKDENFENKLKIINVLLDLLDNILNSEHNCAISLLNVCYNYLICFVKEILAEITLFKEIKLENNRIYDLDSEKLLLNLIFNLEKLYNVCLFLGNGYFIDENDIFNQDTNSDDWKNLSRITYEVIGSEEKDIQNQFKFESIEKEKAGAALLSTYNENSFGVTNAAFFVSKLYTYKKNLKQMEVDSKASQLKQNKYMTKELLTMVRWPIFKKITERKFPSIKYRRKFYIKKEYPDITLDYIQNLLKLMGNEYINVSNIKQEIVYKNKEDIINNKEIPKDELYSIKPQKKLKKYYVSTTLLNSSDLEFLSSKSIFNPFSYFQQSSTRPESLLIFIHGGGFVGMSTHSHEVFLRDWSNKLNIPIIGINYGLSPYHKYPYGLNDCYQGYRWILNHCEDVLGFNPKKIILGGDSSGGTLSLSLIYLIICKNEFEKEKIRLPDLVLPIYPRSNTSIKSMGASILLSLRDFLINDKFLLYANEAYRDIYQNDDDPFLNVVKVKECIIKKLPKMRFQIGSCDPLRDDTVRLLAKIAKIKDLDVKAYELREYNHGYFGGVKSEFLLKIPTDLVFLEIKDILNK